MLCILAPLNVSSFATLQPTRVVRKVCGTQLRFHAEIGSHFDCRLARPTYRDSCTAAPAYGVQYSIERYGTCDHSVMSHFLNALVIRDQTCLIIRQEN